MDLRSVLLQIIVLEDRKQLQVWKGQEEVLK